MYVFKQGETVKTGLLLRQTAHRKRGKLEMAFEKYCSC